MYAIILYVYSDKTAYKTRVFSAIVEMLKWFAGHQIRNVAVSVMVYLLYIYSYFHFQRNRNH